MTIPFEKFKARLLTNPKVRAEYDALAPEFPIAVELVRARVRAGLSQAELGAGRQSVHHRPAGERPDADKYEDTLRYAKADQEQSPCAALGGLMRQARTRDGNNAQNRTLVPE